MTNRFASALVVLAVALGLTASAEAAAIKISDNHGTTYTITDGLAGDINPLADVVTFAGSVGTWALNITLGTGSSNAGAPSMELSSFNASGAGTLTIWFTDLSFGPSGTGVLADIEGFTTGSVKYQTYQSTANQPFAGTQLTNQQFGAGVFSESKAGNLSSGTGPYSLTQKVTITHGLLGTTWFDSSLNVSGRSGGVRTVSVPETGSTALTFGIALLGLALLTRRFPAAVSK